MSEGVHARQRRGMIGPELGLASLHHLHKQLLGLLPPALIPVRRRQDGQASQRVGMVRPKKSNSYQKSLKIKHLSILPKTLLKDSHRNK